MIPEGQSFTTTGRHIIAISPDGKNIVYVANQQLYLRNLADMEARPIQGTRQNPNTPFFSPDGKWVAFWAGSDQKLKKIAITGGAALTISDADLPYGASWAANDQIYVGQGAKGILRVPGSGGKPETVVTVKPGELAHGPQLLDDGDTLLFTVATNTVTGWDAAQIVAQSLRS